MRIAGGAYPPDGPGEGDRFILSRSRAGPGGGPVALLLAAVGVFLLGGLAALLAASSPKLASINGVTGAVAGSLLGLFALVRFLGGGQDAVEIGRAHV